jgi:hypothetical protein
MKILYKEKFMNKIRVKKDLIQVNIMDNKINSSSNLFNKKKIKNSMQISF